MYKQKLESDATNLLFKVTANWTAKCIKKTKTKLYDLLKVKRNSK